MALGVTLFAVDWLEGLPKFWAWWEGPIDFAFGLVIVWLNRRVGLEVADPLPSPRA